MKTPLWPADRAERVPIDELVPNAKNSRTHSTEQVEKIARSLLEYGWTMPLLRDETKNILAGHGRIMGAALLVSRGHEEFREAPTVTAIGWSEAQKRAYIIADNKIALDAGWDETLLRSELGELQALGFDVALTGFGSDELASFFPRRGNQGNPDHIPPTPEDPVSRPGDLWRCGDHWLICGDATDAAVVERVLAGKKAEVCVTDPPYGIGFGYASHDDRSNDANAQLVARVFAHAPAARVWTPGLMNLARDIRRFGEAKVLVWHKGFAAAGNGLGGASTWEPVLVVAPKRKKLANDYLEFKTDREELDGKSLREHHPCPKPVALFAHLVEAFAAPKGLVYEPFSGSGTTIIACQATGRACRAVEIDPAYVDVAIRRWSEFTGFEAFHENGQPWSDVAANRMAEAEAVA